MGYGDGLDAKPGIGGSRCGEAPLARGRFIPAKSAPPSNQAQASAKSPCRGAARRCAAALRAAVPRQVCWAAGRRANDRRGALYTDQIRTPSEPSASVSQIAVPGGGPAMRGGAAHLCSARGSQAGYRRAAAALRTAVPRRERRHALAGLAPAAAAGGQHREQRALLQVDLIIAGQLDPATIGQFGPVAPHGPRFAAVDAEGRHATMV